MFIRDSKCEIVALTVNNISLRNDIVEMERIDGLIQKFGLLREMSGKRRPHHLLSRQNTRRLGRPIFQKIPLWHRLPLDYWDSL
jgi:hypothetical protein